MELREQIENLVSRYCDGTWNGLDGAYIVESNNPIELVDDIENLIKSLNLVQLPERELIHGSSFNMWKEGFSLEVEDA